MSGAQDVDFGAIDNGMELKFHTWVEEATLYDTGMLVVYIDFYESDIPDNWFIDGKPYWHLPNGTMVELVIAEDVETASGKPIYQMKFNDDREPIQMSTLYEGGAQ